jgi:cytochrome c oxidase subunit 3
LAELAHPVAHHFDDAEQQRAAASLGMWVFLVTEVMFFGGLFTAYAAYRLLFPEAFAHASHHLDVQLGTLNTAVLIASSLTMALAVRATQLGQRGPAVQRLVATALLGAMFLGVKAVEYAHKFHEGHVPGPTFTYSGPDAPHAELFFSLYFAMTGVHALHMVIGIGLVAWLVVLVRRAVGPGADTRVELVGLYWHFVDIVWIFLFPFLYLIGRH